MKKGRPPSNLKDKYKVSTPLEPPENYDISRTYDWRDFLDREEFKCVPVEKFQNAPLHQIFHHLRPGLKVEVPNRDYFHQTQQSIGGVYWVAFVVRVAGYKALLRYEGDHQDGSNDFWMNLCSIDLHPVGWCANEGKPLVPPKVLQPKQQDWKSFLVKRLTGSRTLPQDWHEKVRKAVSDCPFRVGHRMEIVDRLNPERVRPARVQQVIGHRLQLIYSLPDQPEKHKSTPKKKEEEDDSGEEDDEEEEDPNEMNVDFWCHEGSPLIFPVGWAVRNNFQLACSKGYRKHCEKIIGADPKGLAAAGESEEAAVYDADDAMPALFCQVPTSTYVMFKNGNSSKNNENTNDQASSVLTTMEKGLEPALKGLVQWQEGMKLECLDPLDMNKIHVASVHAVLGGGYLQIAFDGADGDTFCFHKDSPYLFPIGFCQHNKLTLEAPSGCGTETWDWDAYLKQTKSLGAPLDLFEQDRHHHTFDVGTKLEAVDMQEPKLICSSTVVHKLGSRLLKIRFDGWDESYDQLADFRSPDLFPVGWCETVGYPLEAPRQLPQPSPQGQKRTKPATPVSQGPKVKSLRKSDSAD